MFGLYSRIAAAIALAVFLAGVYWKGHTSGAKSVQAEWDADVAQRTAQALTDSETARLRERGMAKDFSKVDHELQAAKTRRADADRRNAASVQRVENLLAELRTADPAGGTGRTDDPRDGIIGECSIALGKLDQEAGRLRDKVTALQKLSGIVRVKP